MKRIKEVMTANIKFRYPHDDCGKAAKIMKDDNVGIMPVLADKETKRLLAW
ncbi:MAG: hypothetical protein HYX26_07430 [Acidobacteriales bacterium]|nr:hypothetical protein [Terriglobales bacterium]